MSTLLLKKRILKNKIAKGTMFGLTIVSLLILITMAVGLYLKSSSILENNSIWGLISGSEWQPVSGKFGFYSFIISSLYVTILAVAIALPISLLTALFLTENAHPLIKKIIFPVLDILAGIPSVVYGLWGTLIIVPWIADVIGPHFVDYTSGYTVLAGGIVLSVMIIPLLVSLFIEIFATVPKDFKDASTSLGATRWQTSRMVVVRKAMPGIIASVVLAISRAFGETLAVLMVCGNMLNTPSSVFDSCYPLPALIANNYGEMLSVPTYESALMFAALIMFVIILIFNAVSRIILQQVEKKFKL
ncbi:MULTISPECIES: phosphate ABC transporter permease subunit PstC [Dysgonomonas]|uniref:phosphate ABC transporter permease subunit PstC n=1 Tax=Dysgonomonas TaxID=156973 RepID=UPI0004797B87|nr:MULTISPECIES: phosphate ABC transporter permease subunit PstC [Dysgonomonas]MBS7121726.1 phosphate ABC transporter permease subunit PstC [Dysgonomonas sp.]